MKKYQGKNNVVIIVDGHYFLVTVPAQENKYDVLCAVDFNKRRFIINGYNDSGKYLFFSYVAPIKENADGTIEYPMHFENDYGWMESGISELIKFAEYLTFIHGVKNKMREYIKYLKIKYFWR